jgi:hypothetical protein
MNRALPPIEAQRKHEAKDHCNKTGPRGCRRHDRRLEPGLIRHGRRSRLSGYRIAVRRGHAPDHGAHECRYDDDSERRRGPAIHHAHDPAPPGCHRHGAVAAAVTGLTPKAPYVLALAPHADGSGPLEPLAAFNTNAAGAAIVNAAGPIRQLMHVGTDVTSRYLVVAPGTDDHPSAAVQVQTPRSGVGIRKSVKNQRVNGGQGRNRTTDTRIFNPLAAVRGAY